MIVDGRTIDRDSALIGFDVCIVGAGPAGLVAANEFLGCGFRTCLVESGGFEPDAATQLLARFEVEENDDLYPDPLYAHDRRVGGTSAQWDVLIDRQRHLHLVPLDEPDFLERHWVPNSGWPISARTLAPFLSRAQQACEAGNIDYRPEAHADHAHPIFESERLASRVVSFGAQDVFQKHLPQRLASSPDVTLITWSNVVELLSNRTADTISAVQVACMNGNRFTIKPRMLILAQGAFEVPRLLLASRSTAQAGIGNHHDLVGRYLMDRQIVRTGVLTPASAPGLRKFAFYDMHRAQGKQVLGKLTLSPRTLREEAILGNLISFSPRERFSAYQALHRPFGRETTSRAPAHRSARALVAAWRERKLPRQLPRHLLEIARGIDDLVYIKMLRRMSYRPEFNFDSLGWQGTKDFEARFSALDVHQMCEQSPDPHNRITLTAERDVVGMPQGRVKFKWNDLDIFSIVRTQDILKEELAGAGIGDLRIERREGYPILAQMSAHHPSGTTRMSHSPRSGVVDAECKVHGVSNLFVASSSVFPTSGFAPPTLTILALAIRVADRVKELLQPTRQHLLDSSPATETSHQM